MPYRDIFVHLDDCRSCPDRIDAAISLASRQQARITGVALALESTIASYIGIEFPSALSEQQQKVVREAAERAVAHFEKKVKQAGLEFESHIVSCGAPKAPAVLSYYARHADIAFMGQPNPKDAAGSFQETLLEGVLFASGRPVYIVPYIGRPHYKIRKAVIAWDGGRKAARAVHDAIPLLRGRGEAIVLVVNPDERKDVHGEKPGRYMAEHLRRHDIDAQVDIMVAPEASPDTVLLNYVADVGADLLIMGAYGHSRLRERAFGGVTNTILHHMTTPVLMSE